MLLTIRKVATALVLAAAIIVALFSFPPAPTAEPCGQEWAEAIKRDFVESSDREGHGPDLLSSEWFHVVERGLHMVVLPSTDHNAHCLAVARQIAEHR
jgi:hypothetical protein